MISTPFVLISLGLAISIGYVLLRRNRVNKMLSESLRLRNVGIDTYVEEQALRWAKGEIKSKIEKSISGKNDLEIIEPMPGWKIVVGTVARGKPAVLTKSQLESLQN